MEVKEKHGKKREYPRTVLRKKVFKGLFWAGFTFVLFLSVVAIVRVGNANGGIQDSSPAARAEQISQNPATSIGAQTFAQIFATHYFHWENTDEGRKKRAATLKYYLAKGMEEQAGLSFDGLEWNSSLDSSRVWEVKETGNDTAIITLRVKQRLHRTIPPDKKAIEAAKKAKKDIPKPKEEEKGPFTNYFAIPVKTDGQSYVVHRKPYYVPEPFTPDIQAHPDVSPEGRVNDAALQKQVTDFLQTFFKVYTTGTQEELTYYTTGEDFRGMKGIVTFQEVKELLLKEGKKPNETRVFTTIRYSVDHSKAQVAYNYELLLEQEGDRWLVKRMHVR
ncbi:conjugal transfer protein [Thalassobacillus pellis]|uniref:conjugal transfer protein n=1 Tax=Thalassobacillus pellis TaxID=748008 RepID=UPI00195FE85C|nr:conjugal transfer protein [Thalassobacillus pellis]MBM7554574.1 hypothetical protein [Thalassobacillus pellis]